MWKINLGHLMNLVKCVFWIQVVPFYYLDRCTISYSECSNVRICLIVTYKQLIIVMTAQHFYDLIRQELHIRMM